MFSVYQASTPEGVKDFACQVQFGFIPNSPFLIYAALETHWAHIWNVNMYLHYSEKSETVHWPKIRTSEVKEPRETEAEKKLNCAGILASFNMPDQGFTKYI